jgi:two-component system nitrogen regulation sensor histidine kinase GlnL
MIAPAPDAASQISGLIFAVILVDPEHRVQQANPAAESFIGKSLRRIKGRPLEELMEFAEPGIAQHLRQTEAQLIARRVAVRLAGNATVVNVTASPLAGHPGWRVLTLSDAQQDDRFARDADEAASRTPAILAHEIKNPLAAIRGAAQLIGRTEDERTREMSNLIGSEVDRIAALVDRMQSIGREKGEPNAPCNLHIAIRKARQVIETASSQGEAAPTIAINEEFDPSLPLVSGNEDSLIQVLINLMDNARDACRNEPDPQITISTRFVSGLVFRAFRLGRPVTLPIEVCVSDNGPGVDSDLAAQIFEPFVSSKRSGQGLGLALVRRLVHDMNGRISMDRDTRAGLTNFRVSLPVAEKGQAEAEGQGE